MRNLFSYFQQEFKRSPLWQKIVLVVLLTVLFYSLAVTPGFRLTRQMIKSLDEERDQAFGRLQTARYIIEDEPAISRNYREAREYAGQKVFSKESCQKLITRIVKETIPRVQEVHFPENQQSLDGFRLITVQVKAPRITGAQSVKLAMKLEELPGLKISYLDYQNSRLLLEAGALVTDGYVGKTKVLSGLTRSKRIKPDSPVFKLNGFFATGKSKSGALLDGRLFNVGDIYRGYTIIKIDPKARQIQLQRARQILTLKMPDRRKK